MRWFSWRRLLRIFGIFLVAIALATVLFCIAISKRRPDTISGPMADFLARQMLQSVRSSAWKDTGAVKFIFLGHHHLWDRNRNFDCVEWGHQRVLLRIGNRTGKAWKKGVELKGDSAARLVKDAYAAWVNDSFWLNPVVKIFDRGVNRTVVRDPDGSTRLMVEYASGGLTPGDAYLWTPGANRMMPVEWQMWVHILPVAGLRVTWERWITLSTGAKISTLHRIGPLKLQVTDVTAARTLTELLGHSEDPFAPLANRRN